MIFNYLLVWNILKINHFDNNSMFFTGLNSELSSKLEAIPFVDVGVVNIMFKGKKNSSKI